MPDLTIKPNVGNGNKVIIQDQGSVTRLQTDDSGITITAPTVADMSNYTFPTGHVLQTAFYSTTGQPSRAGGNDAGTAFGSLSTPFKKAITPTKNNSDILITISMMVGSSTYAAHLFIQLYDNTNSTVLPAMNTQGHFGTYMTYNSNNLYGHSIISGTFLYENPTIAATPNSIEIEARVAHHAGGTFYLNRRGQDATYGKLTSTIVLQEIAG